MWKTLPVYWNEHQLSDTASQLCFVAQVALINSLYLVILLFLQTL